MNGQPNVLNRINFPRKRRDPASDALTQYVQSFLGGPPQAMQESILQPAIQPAVQPTARPATELATPGIVPQQVPAGQPDLQEIYRQILTPGVAPTGPQQLENIPGRFEEGIGAGLTGIADYLKSPEGMRLAATLTGDEFAKEELFERADIEEARQQQRQAAFQRAEQERLKTAADILGKEREFGLKTEKQLLEEKKFDLEKAIKGRPQFKKEYIKGVGVFDPNTGKVQKILGAPTIDPEKKFDQENKLRTEYNKKTQEFRSVRNSTIRLRESAKDPSAAGDLAMIFNYMKILDPGSVVREREFATAQNAAGVPERTRALYNRILKGERLSKKMRADFLDRGNRLFKGQEKQYKRTGAEYIKLAGQYGLEAKNIVLEETIPTVTQELEDKYGALPHKG